MKLLNILLENSEFKQEEEKLKKDLENNFGKYNYVVNLSSYNQDRNDDDPLKGKGFGKVRFMNKEDIDENLFNKVVAFLEKIKGYKITEKTREYDFEPGERDYFPQIKFNFNLK
jgi:hypothetical protein